MAERTVNSVTSAMTGELTSRVFCGLIQRYGKHSCTPEKLQQLEMLLIKIHSAVEASEKRTIENSWLLQWRDKLKEAAKQGDRVLASFQQRVKDAQGTNTDGNQQQGEAASSSGTAPVSALSFTRNSLSSMVHGILCAREMLFSSANDDMEILNKAVERLEKLSPDIGEFIRLLHLEALPKLGQTSCSTTLSTKMYGPTTNVRKSRGKKRSRSSIEHNDPSSVPQLFGFRLAKVENPEEVSPQFGPGSFLQMHADFKPSSIFDLECSSAVLGKELQFMLLKDRLEAAFAEICKAVELADRRDLKDLEWLSYWADTLRLAKELGHDVINTTGSCKPANVEELTVECDQDNDDLSTFVVRLEGLAKDVEYFSKLLYVCPPFIVEYGVLPTNS